MCDFGGNAGGVTYVDGTRDRWRSRQYFHRYVTQLSFRWLSICSPNQEQVGQIRRSSASPRPPNVDIPTASVWPSSWQRPGPSCPYPSDRPPSGHRLGRRQARHVHILQTGLRLAIAQADARPAMPISFR